MQAVISAVDTISESIMKGLTLGNLATVINVAGKMAVSVQIAEPAQMANMSMSNPIGDFVLNQFDPNGGSCFKNKVRPIGFIDVFFWIYIWPILKSSTHDFCAGPNPFFRFSPLLWVISSAHLESTTSSMLMTHSFSFHSPPLVSMTQ